MSWTKSVLPFLSAAALLAIAASGASAQSIPLAAAPAASPDHLTVVYDPASGQVTATSPLGTQLTAFELRGSIIDFRDDCGSLYQGPFDVCSSEKMFRLIVDGAETFDMGEALPTGLTTQQIADDIVVNGATLGGGFDVGDGAIVVAVPEPVSAALLVIGSLGMLVLRRRS